MLPRYFRIQKFNAEIEDRNDARQESARLLKYPKKQLTDKLRSARQLSKRTVVQKEDIVFTTAEDVEKQAQDWESEDFDARLSKLWKEMGSIVLKHGRVAWGDGVGGGVLDEY